MDILNPTTRWHAAKNKFFDLTANTKKPLSWLGHEGKIKPMSIQGKAAHRGNLPDDLTIANNKW